MLIDSPRLTDADRQAWRRWEQLDARLAGGRLERQADTARNVIAGFAAAGACYVGVSWGKDSVVVAHLADGLGLPLVHVTHNPLIGRVANPDCFLVRDAFLASHPPARYVELEGTLEDIPGRVGIARYVSGVRAEESATRRRALQRHGTASVNTARPIGRWSAVDVWAYLHLHNLPVHPAYAMTYGGQLDRSKLRVHSLLGTGEDPQVPWGHGTAFGRREWECAYYPQLTLRSPSL